MNVSHTSLIAFCLGRVAELATKAMWFLMLYFFHDSTSYLEFPSLSLPAQIRVAPLGLLSLFSFPQILSR